MRRVMLFTLLALALPTAVFANSSDPLNINFAVSAFGRPHYIGATLDSSTALLFRGVSFQVSDTNTGDQSGLVLHDTVTLSPTLSYGPGDDGSLKTPLIKSWSGTAGSFSESFTTFTADRSAPDAITLTLSGTLTGPGANGEPVQMILSATQVGGPHHAISLSLTDRGIGVSPVPEPGTLGLLELGLVGNGVLGLAGMARRKLKLGA